MRTALGLIAGGVATVQLIPGFSTGWVRTTLGLVLILLGSGAALMGLRRWLKVRHALESDGDMPDGGPLWVLAVLLAVVGVVVAVAAVVGRVS